MDILEELDTLRLGPSEYKIVQKAYTEIERLRSMTKVNLDAFHNNVAEIERLREALKEYDCGCSEKWWAECSEPCCGVTAIRALQQKESE